MQSGEIFSPPSGPDLIVMPKAIVLRQVIVFNNTWRVCIYVHVEREYLHSYMRLFDCPVATSLPVPNQIVRSLRCKLAINVHLASVASSPPPFTHRITFFWAKKIIN